VKLFLAAVLILAACDDGGTDLPNYGSMRDHVRPIALAMHDHAVSCGGMPSEGYFERSYCEFQDCDAELDEDYTALADECLAGVAAWSCDDQATPEACWSLYVRKWNVRP
jgi:hypothetical protein